MAQDYRYIQACCFNSLMVRLKELEDAFLAMPVSGFNSLMVRLKVMTLNIKLVNYLRFNSLMVRLKVEFPEKTT